MVWRIDDDERRARLARRHRLAPEARADDAATVARDLVAVHSSDPATVHLTIAARLRDPAIATVEEALYEERSLVRHHAMRRTMWVMTTEIARLAHGATTRRIAGAERAKVIGWLDAVPEIDDASQWLDGAVAAVASLVAERGAVTAREVGRELPGIVLKVQAGSGRNPMEMNVHPKVLQLGGFEAQLVRTEPTGTWVSSEYRWSGMEHWLGTAIDDVEEADAIGPLLDRYLRAFGPVTMTDIRWWFGWTAGLAKRAAAACGAEPVELETGEGWVAAGDTSSTETASGSWVALLPGLDATTMGWKERGFYLDETMTSRLFDRFLNAGPTVWADGRVVGGWIQRDDGEIALDLLADLSAAHRRLLADEIDRMRALLGDTVVRPRFPSANQKGLLA